MPKIECGFRLAAALTIALVSGQLLNRENVSAEPPWPDTPAGAAGLFGGQPDRWEKNKDGGWHFKVGNTSVIINPQGRVMEGFTEGPDGKVICVVTPKSIALKGATVWPVSGEEAAPNLLAQLRGAGNPNCELVITEARGAEITEQVRGTGTLEVTSEKTVVSEASVQKWPETPEDAARQFGGNPARWDKNKDGGWHFKVDSKAVIINPGINVMEGYFGNTGFIAVAKAIAMQGGTVWRVAGEEVGQELQKQNPNRELVTTELRGAALTEQARAGGLLE